MGSIVIRIWLSHLETGNETACSLRRLGGRNDERNQTISTSVSRTHSSVFQSNPAIESGFPNGIVWILFYADYGNRIFIPSIPTNPNITRMDV